MIEGRRRKILIGHDSKVRRTKVLILIIRFQLNTQPNLDPHKMGIGTNKLNKREI